MQHDIQASACQYVWWLPDTCLLAWLCQPILVKLLSVQVCAKSTDHVEAIQKMCDLQPVEYGKLDLSHYVVKCAIPLELRVFDCIQIHARALHQ